jgi:hypothetical protein
MKDKLVIVLLIILVVLSFYYTLTDDNREVVYDCRMAEISPDFPLKAKEECRKLRMEHIPRDKDVI